MIRLRSFLMVGCALLSPSCTTLGGSIKGAFSCRAPAGTCAPTSTIDAKAAESEAASAAPARASERPRFAGSLEWGAIRSPERTMTIVFPAYVDAAGVLHDEATAHAVVEPSRWSAPPTSSVSFSRSPAPSSLREGVAGASARAAEGLETLPAQAPHPLQEIGTLLPDAAAIQAAKSGHRIGQPFGPRLTTPKASGSRVGATIGQAAEQARSRADDGGGSNARALPRGNRPEADPGDIFQPAQTPGGGQ